MNDITEQTIGTIHYDDLYKNADDRIHRATQGLIEMNATSHFGKDEILEWVASKREGQGGLKPDDALPLTCLVRASAPDGWQNTSVFLERLRRYNASARGQVVQRPEVKDTLKEAHRRLTQAVSLVARLPDATTLTDLGYQVLGIDQSLMEAMDNNGACASEIIKMHQRLAMMRASVRRTYSPKSRSKKSLHEIIEPLHKLIDSLFTRKQSWQAESTTPINPGDTRLFRYTLPAALGDSCEQWKLDAEQPPNSSSRKKHLVDFHNIGSYGICSSMTVPEINEIYADLRRSVETAIQHMFLPQSLIRSGPITFQNIFPFMGKYVDELDEFDIAERAVLNKLIVPSAMTYTVDGQEIQDKVMGDWLQTAMDNRDGLPAGDFLALTKFANHAKLSEAPESNQLEAINAELDLSGTCHLSILELTQVIHSLRHRIVTASAHLATLPETTKLTPFGKSALGFADLVEEDLAPQQKVSTQLSILQHRALLNNAIAFTHFDTETGSQLGNFVNSAMFTSSAPGSDTHLPSRQEKIHSLKELKASIDFQADLWGKHTNDPVERQPSINSLRATADYGLFDEINAEQVYKYYSEMSSKLGSALEGLDNTAPE